MKQISFCMLAISIMTIILAGCKNQISQEKVFQGEWDYTEPDTIPNPPNDPYGADMTTNYFVKCNLYEKIDFGEGFPQCYGYYQITNEVNQTTLAIDSILYISSDSAEVLAYNFDYPEEPKIRILFKYSVKDSTLVINSQYKDGHIVREILHKCEPSDEDRD